MAEEKKKQIFRQKSLDRIDSPEQLTDYLRVTNPGMWALFAVILLLLAGLFAWASVGQLETVAGARATVKDGTARITVSETVSRDISSGMTVRVGKGEFTVTAVGKDDSGRTVAYAPVTLSNGEYDDVQIVVESVSPISFLFTS